MINRMIKQGRHHIVPSRFQAPDLESAALSTEVTQVEA
jgi:hypothetical protein